MDGWCCPGPIRTDPNGKAAETGGKVGFDWPDATGALDKINEEVAEDQVEMEEGNQTRLQDELGDMLFAMVNLVRLLGMDAE